MGAETVPEIRRCNLSNTVLTLKALDIDDVIGFDFIDRPSQTQMEEVRFESTLSFSLGRIAHVGVVQGLVLLHQLGALDDFGRITHLGRDMVELPLDPSLSRMLVEACRRYSPYRSAPSLFPSFCSSVLASYIFSLCGSDRGCLWELACIAAVLSSEEVFCSPRGLRRSSRKRRLPQQQEEEDEEGGDDEAMSRAHALLRHPLGDHFTYLRIIAAFDKQKRNSG
jgi:HrpA-like RNA helicase